MSARRIVIAGGPRSGKSTLGAALSAAIGAELRATDELVGVLEWSEASLEVSRWMSEPGPWIIEGVATGRALRKWLAANQEGKPCDEVIYLDHAWTELTKGQAAMGKGCRTVFDEIRPALEARGVRITIGRTPELDLDGRAAQ